ncbi:MAG: RimK family alpha-L-glutamate ligase, partial [Clostridiales bacterium]|nr:RimK family alpha-L-glutamate ligase [Clostridiales bacterium]
VAFPAYLDGKLEIIADCAEFDFCIYLDKDKYLPRMLEGAGMRLFNRARAVELCDDKMATFIALQGTGIPVPKTLPAPLSYTPQIPASEEMLQKIESELGLPVVVKECYGSLGKGVHLARNMEELRMFAEALKGKPHLFQEFVEESAGRDLRVIVVGGEAVACMQRVSACDFRSNAELGGQGVKCDLPKEGEEIACLAAKTLGLDYCGIDLLYGKDGFKLCEVNSNAYFGTIERVSGVNVAEKYADYICKEIYA